MKLLELYLYAFGPFTDLTIDLSGGKEGLHIIYGPNEAGKSSALRAITALFYGIPVQSSDNFLHEHKNLRVGSRLIHSDGSELTFTRRKGRKNTLIDPDGSSLPDTSLQKYIGNMGEDIFSSLPGFFFFHPASYRFWFGFFTKQKYKFSKKNNIYRKISLTGIIEKGYKSQFAIS